MIHSGFPIGVGDTRYVLKSGDTMTGNLVFSGAQKIIGGTGTTDNLTLQTTSGAGANGADMHFLVGNNGDTEALTILNNGNIGIQTPNPDAKLKITDTPFNYASLSAEYITNAADRDFSSATGNWSGTNWSIGAGVATHVTGNNQFILSNTALTAAPASGEYYRITMTITTTTVGSGLDISFGSASLGSSLGTAIQTETLTVTIKTTGTGAFTITPGTTWQGTIDNVSIKKLTPTIAGIKIYNNGDNAFEIRTQRNTNKNTIIGADSGLGQTNGIGLLFIGTNAGKYAFSGNSSVIIGESSGLYNYGEGNVFLGQAAGKENTEGNYNLFIGAFVGSKNRKGRYNTFFGYGAGSLNINGSYNTAIGYQAGALNISGEYNFFLGYQAGSTATGSNNIIIGKSIQPQSSSGNDQLSIGNLIIGAGGFGTGTTMGTGRIGIAVAAPTARLHLPAGTASANTAPLKITSGTLNTTPEAGAIEFDGTNLYFTRSDGTRKQIQVV